MSIVDVKKAGARPEGAFWHGTSVHGDLRAMTLGSGHATGASTGRQQFFQCVGLNNHRRMQEAVH
jgi:hypothetical protein